MLAASRKGYNVAVAVCIVKILPVDYVLNTFDTGTLLCTFFVQFSKFED